MSGNNVTADARTVKSSAPAGGSTQRPSHQGDGKGTANLPLGVDVAILWRGDMLTARFFASPKRVTVGPKGTFVMPEDVIGVQEQVLVEPRPGSQFGLRIDNDKAKATSSSAVTSTISPTCAPARSTV